VAPRRTSGLATDVSWSRHWGALLSSVVLSISPAWSATKTAHASSAVVTVRLEQPTGMVAASDGLLFIADQSLNQVLVRLPTGHLQSIAGNGHAGFSGDGGLATQGELDQPGALALAPNGIMYVADVGNHRIRALLRMIASPRSPATAPRPRRRST